MQPPSAEHWFGTDNTGRDILSRVIYGTRNTLMLGLVGVIVGGLIGGVLGILAAYYRAARRLDHAPGRHDAGVSGDPDRACGGRDLRRRARRRGDRAGRRDRARCRAGGARRRDRGDGPGIHGGRPRRRRVRHAR